MSGDQVLVTGASGYIAKHVVQQLLQAGYRVRGTVRSLRNPDKIQPIRALCPDSEYPLELVEADLMDPDCWPQVVSGCKYVVHMACPLPTETPKDEMDQIRPALAGVQNVFQAVRDSKCVKRVVLTSSIASVRDGYAWEAEKTYRDNDWTDVNKKNCGTYCKSKTLAERAAWDFLDNITDKAKRFEMVVLNPTMVVGPVLCGTPSASTKLLTFLMNKEIPFIPGQHTGYVDVRDVAKAHVIAMTSRAAANKRFILNTECLWVTEIADILNEEFVPQGYSLPSFVAPYWMMWIYSFCNKTIATYLPTFYKPMLIDNSTMLNVLKIDPIPTKKSLIDMAYTMIETGLIKKTPEYRGPPK